MRYGSIHQRTQRMPSLTLAMPLIASLAMTLCIPAFSLPVLLLQPRRFLPFLRLGRLLTLLSLFFLHQLLFPFALWRLQHEVVRMVMMRGCVGGLSGRTGMRMRASDWKQIVELRKIGGELKSQG